MLLNEIRMKQARAVDVSKGVATPSRYSSCKRNEISARNGDRERAEKGESGQPDGGRGEGEGEVAAEIKLRQTG